jgi:hypothetical protein
MTAKLIVFVNFAFALDTAVDTPIAGPLVRQQARQPSSDAPSSAFFEVDDALGEVAAHLATDPFLLVCSLLLTAYLIGESFFKQSSAPKSDPFESMKAQKAVGKTVWQPRQKAPRSISSLNSAEQVLSFVKENASSLPIPALAAALQRLQKLTRKGDERLLNAPDFHLLLDELERSLRATTNTEVLLRAVSSTLWALAKLGYSDIGAKHPELVSFLKEQFMAHTSEFRIEELNNMIYAFGELRRPCGIQVLDVTIAVCNCGDAWASYSDEELIFLMWALVRVVQLSHVRTHPEVAPRLEQLLSVAGQRFSGEITVCPKFVVMLCWAVANFGQSPGVTSILEAIAIDVSKRDLTQFHAGEVTSLVSTSVKCELFDSPLYEKYKAHCVLTDFSGFSSQDFANALCAFARAEVCDDSFLQKLSSAMGRQGVRFNSTEERMVKWARKMRPLSVQA